MTSSTTLMTFLVRAPATTHSVTLLGSWDNFTKEYPMKRDTFLGSEHWSGCHSFSNIIYDGEANPKSVRREGGLKMGGTYWYFYKLDDDIEFHNTAQTSTTQCPLLPGQLVNVLQVPYVFASGRSRTASSGSATSEYRTLNPSDKYMNPRPVPKLPRLNTSPTFPTYAWSTTASPVSPWSATSPLSRGYASQPGSATTTKKFLLPRKPSTEQLRAPTSSGSVTSGFRQAFRTLRPGRAISPERTADVRGEQTADTKEPAAIPFSSYYQPSREVPARIPRRDRSVEEKKRHIAELDVAPISEFRKARHAEEAQESIASTPLQQRRQRSRSRGPSSLRNSVVLEAGAVAGSLEIKTQHVALDTLKEVASTQTTPMWPTTAKKVAGPHLDKRLPTLPNTPSSVYPPSEYCNDESEEERRQKTFAAEMENLESHFSCTTIATEPNTDSISWPAGSHHYLQSIASPTDSTFTIESIDEQGPVSPDAVADTADAYFTTNAKSAKPSTGQPVQDEVTSLTATWSSSSMGTSTTSSTEETGSTEADRDMTPTRSDPLPRIGNFQHYCLPVTDHSSEVTLKQFPLLSPSSAPVPSLHSDSMQQLLAELSYLGGMIQRTS